MIRRHLALGVAAGLALRPAPALGQTARRRVGVLSIGGSGAVPTTWRPFFERMAELGYEEGRNVVYQRAFAGGRVELIERFAADMVASAPDVIVITASREGRAVKRTGTAIPCVMFLMPDPVEAGLAASLARPGANFTGVTTMDRELYAKRLELLREAVPTLRKARVIVGQDFSGAALASPWMREMHASARKLDIALDSAVADAPFGTAQALAQAAADSVQGLVFLLDGQHVAHRPAIAEQAIAHRLPTMFTLPEFVVDGGLMSYAARISANARRAAEFVDRVLRGTNPAELPIERPTAFDLVINQTTARRIGVEFPAALLQRADEVIE